MQKIKSFIRNRSKIQIILAVVVVIVGIFVFTGGGNEKVPLVVERGTVEQEVVATGKVVSRESVNLAFEVSGKIQEVNARVGDSVASGQAIVVLDQDEVSADLNRAKALLNEALVTLGKTERTSSSSYGSSYTKSLVALGNAYTETRDAVYNTADRFFMNALSSSPILDISYYSDNYKYQFTTSYEVSSSLSVKRAELNDVFLDWKKTLDSVKDGGANLTTNFAAAESNINTVKDFLTDLATVMNSISQNDQTQEAVITSYRESLSTVRSSINTTQNKLLDAREAYESSPRITSTSSSYDSVLEQQARVDVARADVDALEAKLRKTVIRSPINGRLTKQEGKIGEIVTVGEEIVSIISDKAFEVEADISEINIGKISSGDEVTIELDAFPNEYLSGRVSYVEPGEKIVDGVVNYEIKVDFDQTSSAVLKTGLTASLRILTDRKNDVLKLPAYAIERRGSSRFVTLKTEEGEEDVEVKTGLFGKDGSVEIITGLSYGDTVLVDSKSVK